MSLSRTAKITPKCLLNNHILFMLYEKKVQKTTQRSAKTIDSLFIDQLFVHAKVVTGGSVSWFRSQCSKIETTFKDKQEGEK